MRGQFHIMQMMATRIVTAAVGVALISGALTGSATAQSTQPIPVQPNIATLQAQGHVFVLGEPCQRMSGGDGIIKRDACQRWYCSRLGYQDITERRPNLAAEIGCEWRLVGVHCLCEPTGARPKPK